MVCLPRNSEPRVMLRRLARLSPAEWTLLIRAWIVVGVVRVLLWALPWRRVRRALLLGRSNGILSFPDLRGTPPDDLEWAVRAAGRLIPFATCLTQALALQWLLGGARACQVCIGVKVVHEKLEAHAWVEHRGVILLDRAAHVVCYSRLGSLSL
jgi:hypothetical protein